MGKLKTYIILLYINDYYICTENNCKFYGVTFQNKGWIEVQELKDFSEDEKIIYKVNPMETDIGKSVSCEMTEFSRAGN